MAEQESAGYIEGKKGKLQAAEAGMSVLR